MFPEELVRVPDVPSDVFELPAMPLRDLVVFPTMVIPLFVGRNFSIRAVEEALKKDRLIFLILQKDKSMESPNTEDLYTVGTIAHVVRSAPIEENRLKILVQGIKRARLLEYRQTGDYYTARVQPLEEVELDPETLSSEVRAYIRSVKEQLDTAVSLGKQVIPDLIMVIKDLEDPGRLADLTASILDIKAVEAQRVLETFDPVERLKLVHQYLQSEVGLLEVQSKIRGVAREKIEKEQREYFLRQQLKAILEELGEGDERRAEIEEYRKKLSRLKISKEAREEIEKQIKRLEKLHPESAEAGVLRTWLEWVLDLPWDRSTRDRYDLDKAREILDRDHYNLEKVKDRIVEYLAVKKLTKGKSHA
ncbi:MAG: LON peptidase substrate-binding domain-containing protein, partial [Aquificaceae bacterium]